MKENIFKKIEAEKTLPDNTKEEIISKIRAIEKGKEPSRFFNTKLYGSLVNFFKLHNQK